MPMTVEWTVLEPVTLAHLDGRFAAQAARWPTVLSRLCERLADRSHTLAVHLAITCLVGTRLRLYVLFWFPADRFGHVDRDGIVIPLHLTHETLAHLAAARRPTVSTALVGPPLSSRPGS